MFTLIITDSSLYSAQWDYQDDKPVLFSLVKVKFHSALSSIRSKPDEIQNDLRTAISQVDEINNVQGMTCNLILDGSLTEKDSINIGEISDKNDIKYFLLWTLRKRWGPQANLLSFTFIPGKINYYYFAFPRLILTQLNNILNESGLINISFQPIELIFQTKGGENGILFKDGNSDSLICFTKTGIMSCKIVKRKNNFVLTDIIGNAEDIMTKVNDENYKILRAEEIEENKFWKNRKISQLTPFQNVVTESIDMKLKIPDRILNALDRSIIQYSNGNNVDYYLDPFINIMDQDEPIKKIQSSQSEIDYMKDKKEKFKNEKPKETGSKWITVLILIILTGLIMLKNSDTENWREELIKLFHPTENFEKSKAQISNESRVHQFEPYVEYNLSRAILNASFFSFKKIELKNIVFLSSSDNKFTIISSTDTLHHLFSSSGLIENERKLNDNRFQIDLTLHTEKTIPNSFIQTIEDIISFFGKNNSLTSHRKLEKKVSGKFIYDPLILSFSDVKSPLDVLVKMRELGGNVLIRKIEYTTLTDNRKKSGLTIYLSVIHMD